jgi:hypothetical protein
MSDQELLSDGGNTVPAVLVLRDRGFVLSRIELGDSEQWIAERDDLRLVAEDPLMLLGLLTMREQRGYDWAAADNEIHAFFRDYYPEEASPR